MRNKSYSKPQPKCTREHVDIEGADEDLLYCEDPHCVSCASFHEGPLADNPKRVLVAGDTHGDPHHVQWLLTKAEEEEAEAVFVLGDFGIWDHMDDGRFTDLVSKFAIRAGIPVLFLPGNHDNYDLLFQWEAEKLVDADGFVILKPGLGYSPRGHRWIWNGIHLMSLGGAYSIDKDYRVAKDQQYGRAVVQRVRRGAEVSDADVKFLETGQRHWWHQEEISEEELEHALRPGEIDILLTHDKPRKANPDWNRKDLEECWENQQAVQDVIDAKKPQLVVHGHLHHSYIDVLDHGTSGTHVQGLDCDPQSSRESGGSGLEERCYGVLSLGLASGYGIGFRSDKSAFVGWSPSAKRAAEAPLRED